MFGIGLEPTGSKDPFGLRRAANGIVKILAESGLQLRFSDLYMAVDPYLLPNFFRERVEFYMRNVCGLGYDIVNAVLAAGFNDVVDAIARGKDLSVATGSEEFKAICASFKRMSNILRQASDEDKLAVDSAPVKVESKLFTDHSETDLYQRTVDISQTVKVFRCERQYLKALDHIATLGPHIDLFFERVMVMVEDEAIRRNRLRLLRTILAGFSSIADFSEIVTS